MKLKFHNTDHADVELQQGITLVGSDPECTIMLRGVGIAARHCRIDVQGEEVLLRILDSETSTVLNGRRVHGDAKLQSGDLLLFGQVGCQVLGTRQKQPETVRTRSANDTAEPVCIVEPVRAEHATQMRGVLPRLVLRGLSGPMLGRSFPLRDGMVFGRSRECDVFIESQEISREHARLRVRPDAVTAEDLQSTNGTFVNDQRITNSPLRPGDELRLDTVRFVLVEPGSASNPVIPHADHEGPSRGRAWLLVALVLLLGALLAWLWWAGGLGNL